MTVAPETYYQILGIGEDATPDQVATARRSMLKAVHPDLATDEADRQERERLSRTVNDMCDTLLDPLRRWDYDRALARARQCAARSAPRDDLDADEDDPDDPLFEDERWDRDRSPEPVRTLHIPGLEWLDQWLTGPVLVLSVLMLIVSTLIYQDGGHQLLDALGLHLGRFGSAAVVLLWTVILVALCLGVARWIRARRTRRG